MNGYFDEAGLTVEAYSSVVTEPPADSAEGPIPADTVFFRMLSGTYDAVIVMYHDQGHIPLKSFGIYEGVNITLGLPIIRTSVGVDAQVEDALKALESDTGKVFGHNSDPRLLSVRSGARASMPGMTAGEWTKK